MIDFCLLGQCKPFFEFIYSAIFVFFCFLIFYKTKESYKITKYLGIKYFRNAFLFFGISYFSRFLFYIIFLLRYNLSFFLSFLANDSYHFMFPRPFFFEISLIFLAFFSTTAIFYLLLSSIWKKINNKQYLIVSYASSLMISFVVLFFKKPEILLFFQLFLVIFALILMFYLNKKISKTYTYYLFIFVFWLVNILFLWFLKFPFQLQIIIQFLCVLLFFMIYKKISGILK